MKRLTAILALIVITVSAGYSQNLKFGHVNGNEVVQALPEFDSANVKLENFQKELINALELMSVELNNKNDAYTKEEKNLTDLVKQTKQQEIIDLNRRMQDFQAKAQDDLRLRQQQLFQPIQEKVEKAIKDVGKENGFVYIFDIGTGVDWKSTRLNSSHVSKSRLPSSA